MVSLNRQARRASKWLEFFTGPPPAIRTVEVLPPSQSDETVGVFLTAAFVVLCVIYTLAFQLYGTASSLGDRAGANGLLPFQQLFRDLPSKEQRVFRAMQEGQQEAMRARAAEGAWPTVEALAALGIPPFAPDVLDKSALSWAQYRDGLTGNYVGVPAAGTDMPAFLILIQEPPLGGGEQVVPSVVDEEHQLLPDGTLLHVTYWKRPRESLRPGLVIDPALSGWSQIRVGSPQPPVEGR